MRFLLATLVALFLSIPATAGDQRAPFWTCMQIGHLNKQPVMVISDIQTCDYKSHKAREDAFASAVKKTWKLTGEYEPACQDFISEREAKLGRKFIFKKAKRAGLGVLEFKFKFGGKNVRKEGK